MGLISGDGYDFGTMVFNNMKNTKDRINDLSTLLGRLEKRIAILEDRMDLLTKEIEKERTDK